MTRMPVDRRLTGRLAFTTVMPRLKMLHRTAA
jgi:hypothetical protein